MRLSFGASESDAAYCHTVCGQPQTAAQRAELCRHKACIIAAERHTWRHHFKAEPELQVNENTAADTGEPFNQLLIKTNTSDVIVPFSPSCSCQSIEAALSFSSDRSRCSVLQQLQLRPFRAESVELKPQLRVGCLHRGPPSLSDRRSASLEPLSIVPRRTRPRTPNSQSK
ncbi:hypothetical protein GOODEAATRI_010219 [Goodea atripinnis]|uniref:Uncharacterized protein n=1 Tax=Goodea atripinnis TaxID=208336 RepID=A0ABV0NJ25_9TELE